MAVKVDKLIVSNVSELKAKYGSKLPLIKQALAALVASDAERGLVTRLVMLDSAAALKRVRGSAVSKAGDERQTKAAIDALCKFHAPDYLMIVGAQDVVPHVALRNPMNTNKKKSDDDDDDSVPSDLPYACDAPFSREPRRFLGPTRVVGRLPDLPGASSPEFLLQLLDTCRTYVRRPRSDYSSCFALSARVWVDSTELSVNNLFGNEAKVKTSPTAGPNWTTAQLAPRIHFINCHGETDSPTFLGEGPEGSYFDAHKSARLQDRVSEGSVIAAECCYGAQLYDPADANGEMGICTRYLREGAYGFFGSTTIAYGPAEGNGQADLICQYFVESILKGASLGRSALEALHRFIGQYSHHDPTDLKTIVQFMLLGDPSVHAVQPALHSFERTKTFAKCESSGTFTPSTRSFRRERLARTGHNFSRSIGAAVSAPARPPKAVRALLMSAARESKLHSPRLASWHVQFPGTARETASAEINAERRNRSIHAIIGRVGSAPGRDAGTLTAIIATVQGRRIVHVRRVHSR